MALMKGFTLDLLMMVFLFIFLVTFLGAVSMPATATTGPAEGGKQDSQWSGIKQIRCAI